MLYQRWRKVEESGEWSTFMKGLRNAKPQTFKPQTTYPRYGAYYIPRYMVCQAPKYRPKMCRNVTKRYN